LSNQLISDGKQDSVVKNTFLIDCYCISDII